MFAIMNPATDVVTPLIQTTTINTERMAYLIERNFSTATELANYLVSKHDVPFRQAHHIVGSLVGSLHRAGKDFSDFAACLSHLQKEGVKTAGREAEVQAVLSPRDVMRSYNCIGGTGPKAVQTMIDQMYSSLKNHRATLEVDKQRVEAARQATDKIVARLARSSPLTISRDWSRSIAQPLCPSATSCRAHENHARVVIFVDNST